jgi:hypothetical protein
MVTPKSTIYNNNSVNLGQSYTTDELSYQIESHPDPPHCQDCQRVPPQVLLLFHILYMVQKR